MRCEPYQIPSNDGNDGLISPNLPKPMTPAFKKKKMWAHHWKFEMMDPGNTWPPPTILTSPFFLFSFLVPRDRESFSNEENFFLKNLFSFSNLVSHKFLQGIHHLNCEPNVPGGHHYVMATVFCLGVGYQRSVNVSNCMSPFILKTWCPSFTN